MLNRSRQLDTVTSLTLLEGLRDPQNKNAWQRFTDRYEPMVWAFARRLGLNESDAHDAGQETMLTFFRAYQDGMYDRGRGRLRSWLFTIAHRKAIDIYRRRGKERVLADCSNGTAFMASVESPEHASAVWDEQWQQAVLRACMVELASQVDHKTMESFRLYVIEERPADRVAEHLGISRSTVYSNKTRIMNRLRDLQRQMEDIW